MTHDFDLVFDTESPYWQKVLDIFAKNEKYEKKVVSNRNLHHKFPRSFSKKLGEEVDNDKDNLISLSVADHFLVHYYYYLLAKKGYRQAMALAFSFMAKKCLKYITPETAESMAQDYEEARCIADQGHSESIKEAHKRGCYKNVRKLTSDERKSATEKRKKSFDEHYTDEEKIEIYYKQGSGTRGKTYKEIYGEEKAKEISKSRSESNKKRDYSKFKHKKDARKIRCIETGEIGYISDFRKRYPNGINFGKSLKDKRYTAKGYHWEYVE